MYFHEFSKNTIECYITSANKQLLLDAFSQQRRKIEGNLTIFGVEFFSLDLFLDSKASTSPQLWKSAIGRRTVGSTNQLKSASKQQQIRKFRLEYSRNLSSFRILSSSLLRKHKCVSFTF